MFVIRAAQLHAFSSTERSDFVERMARHLGKALPDQAAAFGHDGLRDLVREGISRSARWGIERERDVCLYLHVMLVLGTRFDEDPALPWARDLLSRDRLNGATRASLLHRRAFGQEVVLGDEAPTWTEADEDRRAAAERLAQGGAGASHDGPDEPEGHRG